MSSKKRSFSPEFKAKVALEAISGVKEINELAAEHQIQPNLIRNWKREFMENASKAFDKKADEKYTETINKLQAENDELAKKVGRQSVNIDWLKKKSEELLGPDYESQFSKKPKGL